MIIKNRFTAFLYFFLFSGAFNDLLRIGTTQINLFRILLPFVFLYNIAISKKARIVFVVFVGFSLITLMQSVAFSFSISRYFEYLFFYFCIFTVIASVVAISELDPNSFVECFESFIITVSICFLIVFVLYYFVGRDAIEAKNLKINNVNNYGAVIVATIPITFFHMIRKKNYLYTVVLLLDCIFLVLNDTKLALIGVLVQLMCLFIIGVEDGSLRRRALLFPIVILLFFVFLFVMHYSNFSLNGYTWIGTVEQPFNAIIHGKMYENSSTSVSFRVNIVIVGLQWIRKTNLLGIGIGNSGVLLRTVLENYNLYDSWLINESISLHNAILEFILEFGLVAIIGLSFFVIQIIKLLKKNCLSIINKEYLVVVISSLFWILGPSGILTDYMIFALFSYLIIANNINNTDLLVLKRV